MQRKPLAAALAVSVVGAQGSIAATEVARATPDGCTLLVTTDTPHAANVSLFKKLASDPVKDFAPIAEELKGFELIAWFAPMAPAGTPLAIVQSLHDVTVTRLARADVKEKFAAIGSDVAPMNPAELGKFMQGEIDHWAKLVKLAGTQPE